MRLSPSLAVSLGLLLTGIPSMQAASDTATVTGDRQFSSPAAAEAQRRFVEAQKRARLVYAAELAPVIKEAMQAGSLEDANAINEVKTRLETGGLPPTAGTSFKTAKANEARFRFEKNLLAVQRGYAAELQPALKAAMAAGQLEEANGINAELKGLATITAATSVDAARAVQPLGMATIGKSADGLMIVRYPKHPSQANGNRTGYVPYKEFGKPIGAPHMVKTISHWTKAGDENAVVSGFLRIDQPGLYSFRTSSGWDRNELLVDDKIVCKFRDGENKVASVELRAGVLPIVSVGYAISTSDVTVQWQPPGATTFSDIPANLFTH